MLANYIIYAVMGVVIVVAGVATIRDYVEIFSDLRREYHDVKQRQRPQQQQRQVKSWVTNLQWGGIFND